MLGEGGGEEKEERNSRGRERVARRNRGGSLKRRRERKGPGLEFRHGARNIGQADGKKEKGCARGAICHGPDRTRVRASV